MSQLCVFCNFPFIFFFLSHPLPSPFLLRFASIPFPFILFYETFQIWLVIHSFIQLPSFIPHYFLFIDQLNFSFLTRDLIFWRSKSFHPRVTVFEFFYSFTVIRLVNPSKFRINSLNTSVSFLHSIRLLLVIRSEWFNKVALRHKLLYF